MDKDIALITCLDDIAKALTKEAEWRKEMGNFGNFLGEAEAKKQDGSHPATP
ncbi:hypothetical protein LCGC14_2338670 [marine sediment metagenome]|uniref:Uncharacterized protein n=1 Tax=marine sediment metagenome TaxID=412755 RepID=A0A0F9D079_9ZZZZ